MSSAKSSPIKASKVKSKSISRKPGFNTKEGLKGFQTADPIVPLAPTANPIASAITESLIVEAMTKAPSGSSLARALIAYQKERAMPVGVAFKAFLHDSHGNDWVSSIGQEIIKEVGKESIFEIEVLVAQLAEKISPEASKGFLLLNALEGETVQTGTAWSYGEINTYEITFTRKGYPSITMTAECGATVSISTIDGIRWLCNWKKGANIIFTPEEITCVRAFAEGWWKEPLELL